MHGGKVVASGALRFESRAAAHPASPGLREVGFSCPVRAVRLEKGRGIAATRARLCPVELKDDVRSFDERPYSNPRLASCTA